MPSASWPPERSPTDDLSRWLPLQSRARRWVPPAKPTVVVAPHPDDESLTMGGLIAIQRARDVPVTVLAVTDGEAAYPDIEGLAELRRREQQDALGVLGVGESQIRRLCLRDSCVDDCDVEDAIEDRIADHGLLVAPWTGDHHRDHEACGRAAGRVAERHGVQIVFGLFWAWHQSNPSNLEGLALRRVDLTDSVSALRREAVNKHRSQITCDITVPLLSERDLAPSRWTSEFYIVPERLDASGR